MAKVKLTEKEQLAQLKAKDIAKKAKALVKNIGTAKKMASKVDRKTGSRTVSNTDIAKHFGVHASTITRWLRK